MAVTQRDQVGFVRVTVDGREVELPEGGSLLHALSGCGVDVPSLCDDPRLAPFGECRMCLVRVDGGPQPVAACMARVHQGMVVETAPADIEHARREILRMLAQRQPVGDDRDDRFHQLLRRYGVSPVGERDPALVDDSHPCIAIDMNHCIDCFRCVRICEEVQGQFAWQVVGRGADSRVSPSGAATLAQSACVSCGACVDTCPTGALTDRTSEVSTPIDRWTRTTCPYCGVGCELLVGTHDDDIVTVVPAHDAPVNRGHACVKGRYAHGFVHAPDRVTQPMVRERGHWRTVSWPEAIGAVARGFRDALERHGPGAVGVLASARATNEENYLLQKFARVVLRTNNVDCCARVCHAPSATALRSIFGTGAATNSFADIDEARTILVCGANATENHPVVGARIKQAALSGASLVVIDPRRIELAAYAEVHLRPRPGTNVLVLNAIAAAIVEEGLVDATFVAERVREYDDFVAHIERFRPEEVAAECGVDAADIRRAARIYATAKPAMAFHGLGVTEHTQGTDGVTCIANLALLTGNVGRPGSGVNPLRGQNNVQGSAHMGCEPDFLTGFAPMSEATRFEDVWGSAVPAHSGLNAMEMIDAATEGTLRALWVVGWDIALTQPDMNTTARALDTLDMLVVQDLFLNETARAHATVFLPACSAYEKDGTFMNGERRVQRVRRALPPVGGSKPDWEIVRLVAGAMGEGGAFAFASAEEIWDEIRKVWPAGAGLGYPRLEAPGGLQWPCPAGDHPGTRVLHAQAFGGSLGATTALARIAYVPTPETPTDAYPYTLVTGRALEQFNAGTMTGRSLTSRLRPTDELEMSPPDAERLQVRDGDGVRVTSRYGSAVLPVRVTDRVVPGECFATFSDPRRAVNRVTGPRRDTHTATPEYKVTAVRLDRTVDQ